jgi:hypothetical protein
MQTLCLPGVYVSLGFRPLSLLTYALETAPEKVHFMDLRPMVRQAKVKKVSVVAPGFKAQKRNIGSLLAVVPVSLAETLREESGDVVLLVRVEKSVFEHHQSGIVIPPGVSV